jgi:hypothetical protein
MSNPLNELMNDFRETELAHLKKSRQLELQKKELCNQFRKEYPLVWVIRLFAISLEPELYGPYNEIAGIYLTEKEANSKLPLPYDACTHMVEYRLEHTESMFITDKSIMNCFNK